MPLGAARNLPVFEKRQSWTRPSAPTSTVNVALPGSPIGKPGSGATDTPSPPSRSSPGSDQRNFAASTPLVGLPSLSSAGENLPSLRIRAQAASSSAADRLLSLTFPPETRQIGRASGRERGGKFG